MISLALRLFDPTQGRVLLDGKPLSAFELDALRDCFSVSMQATVLFGESVRENFLLVSPEATDEEMWAALEKAGVAATIRALPDGLETELGAQGAGLSGGETRRVCLARALLRQGPIMIVDEPFAGLDRDTASLVARTLQEQGRERIVMIITHHLDHLGTVDRVYRLGGGRLLPLRPDDEAALRGGPK